MSKSKIANFLFLLALLSSILYSLQYIRDSFERSFLLSKLDYSQRQIYLEKEFRFPTVFEYADWIRKTIPDKYPFSLADTHTNYMYYYFKLNYHLYPKYISADVKKVSTIQNGKPADLNGLKLTDIVFAVDLSSNDMAALGAKYYVARRYKDTSNYILIRRKANIRL